MVFVTALISLMGISMANGFTVCDFTARVRANELTDASCDIVVYSNSKPSATGKFDKVSPSTHTDAVRALTYYRCGKTVYFEYRICTDDAFRNLLSAPEEAQLRSIEDAIRYAKNSGYNGFMVILCDLNTPEYQALESSILSKVKQLTNELNFTYGIRMSGKQEGFQVDEHKDSAEFIVITHKVLFPGPVSSDYSQSLNLADLFDYWKQRGLHGNRMLFYIRPLVEYSMPSNNVAMEYPANICGIPNMKPVVISTIANIAKTIKDQVDAGGIKGVFFDALELDDRGQGCQNGTFPFLKAIQRNLA